ELPAISKQEEKAWVALPVERVSEKRFLELHCPIRDGGKQRKTRFDREKRVFLQCLLMAKLRRGVYL
ncbi:MAG: hypothetical protein WBE10_16950, partial [Candidatus Acidiferrum sp.]